MTLTVQRAHARPGQPERVSERQERALLTRADRFTLASRRSTRPQAPRSRGGVTPILLQSPSFQPAATRETRLRRDSRSACL